MMDSDAATLNPDATAMDPDAGVADTGSCNTPMVMCGNDCVDLDSDSVLWRCGRDCGFGSCSAAECQAFDYYVNTMPDVLENFGRTRAMEIHRWSGPLMP